MQTSVFCHKKPLPKEPVRVYAMPVYKSVQTLTPVPYGHGQELQSIDKLFKTQIP